MGFMDRLKEQMKRKEKVSIVEAVVEKKKLMYVPGMIEECSIVYQFQKVDVAIDLPPLLGPV